MSEPTYRKLFRDPPPKPPPREFKTLLGGQACGVISVGAALFALGIFAIKPSVNAGASSIGLRDAVVLGGAVIGCVGGLMAVIAAILSVTRWEMRKSACLSLLMFGVLVVLMLTFIEF